MLGCCCDELGAELVGVGLGLPRQLLQAQRHRLLGQRRRGGVAPASRPRGAPGPQQGRREPGHPGQARPDPDHPAPAVRRHPAPFRPVHLLHLRGRGAATLSPPRARRKVAGHRHVACGSAGSGVLARPAQVVEDRAVEGAPLRLGDPAGRAWWGRRSRTGTCRGGRWGSPRRRARPRSPRCATRGGCRPRCPPNWVGPLRAGSSSSTGFSEPLDQRGDLLGGHPPRRGARGLRRMVCGVSRSMASLCSSLPRTLDDAGGAGHQARRVGLPHRPQEALPRGGVLVPELQEHVAVGDQALGHAAGPPLQHLGGQVGAASRGRRGSPRAPSAARRRRRSRSVRRSRCAAP